jgi:hypothetical protein
LVVLLPFLASIQTFFSGFDLGTLLGPLLMFFQVEVAIAMTGVDLCYFDLEMKKNISKNRLGG